MATTDKYDRQLRLWGAAGQRALAETCVVLIRATAAGTETVKNLVLPGIGSVLVLDDVADVGRDYASNFFLVQQTPAPAGSNDNNTTTTKTRAQMALEYLQELNSDVTGSWRHIAQGLPSSLETLAQTIQANCHNKPRVLIVASDLEPKLLVHVATICEKQAWPCIGVHCYGLQGIVRLQAPPLPLLQPKRRDAVPDLRLVQPFPKLQAALDAILPPPADGNNDKNDWSSALDNRQHGHVPYPLILLKLAAQWKANHGGKLPATFAEKQEFQATIKQAARNYDQELNFQEAVNNAYLAYAPRELDLDHLAQLREASAGGACPKLHALLTALEQFLSSRQDQQQAQQPPVAGTIPDMTASTDWYVQLQAVYQEQAAADVAELRRLLPADSGVTDEEVRQFCANIFDLDLLQTRTVAQEEAAIPADVVEDLVMATMEGEERPDMVPLLWYLAFRACQVFFTRYGRYPGVFETTPTGTSSGSDDDEQYQEDVATVHTLLCHEVLPHYGLAETELVQSTILAKEEGDDTTTSMKYAAEMTRYANAEIHTIASVIGGVASQEAVKLLTGQYVPVNNTYVYNGIASTAAVYQF